MSSYTFDSQSETREFSSLKYCIMLVHRSSIISMHHLYSTLDLTSGLEPHNLRPHK